MGYKSKTVGGTGTGIGTDFAQFLQNGLNGQFGSGGNGANEGIGGLLNSILGQGAGTLGTALSSILQTQQKNDVASLRSRYGAAGGTGFGTPAAYGEATYRAQAAPQITSAIGNLQLNALGSILPAIAGIAGKDIPQASTMVEQNPIVQGLSLALPLFSGLASSGAFGGGGISSPGVGAGGGGGFIPSSINNFSAPSVNAWAQNLRFTQ